MTDQTQDASVPLVSDQQVEEWGRLAKEATEGPWTTSRRGEQVVEDTDEAYFFVADCWDIEAKNSHANAAFIASAREAVPALIAERQRLQDEVRRLDALRALVNDTANTVVFGYNGDGSLGLSADFETIVRGEDFDGVLDALVSRAAALPSSTGGTEK